MISSPWAMLMTSIRPNENARPRAISSRIEPRLRPLKTCESQMDMLFTPPRADQTKRLKAGLDSSSRPAFLAPLATYFFSFTNSAPQG